MRRWQYHCVWVGLALFVVGMGPVPEEAVLVDEVPDPMAEVSDLTEEGYQIRFGLSHLPPEDRPPLDGREHAPVRPVETVEVEVLAAVRSSLPAGLLILCDDERGALEADALTLERGTRMLVVRVFVAEGRRLSIHDFVASALNIATPLIDAGRVDPDRVYVAGFGDSARMVCEAALWFGDRIAGGFFYGQAMFYGTQGNYRSYHRYPPAEYRDAILARTYVLGFDTPPNQVVTPERGELRVGAPETQKLMLEWFQSRGMDHRPVGIYFPDVQAAQTGDSLSRVVRYLDRPLNDKMSAAVERYERATRRERFGDQVEALTNARRYCFDADQYAELTRAYRSLLNGYRADIQAAEDLIEAEAWEALNRKISEIRRVYRSFREADVARLRETAYERTRVRD